MEFLHKIDITNYEYCLTLGEKLLHEPSNVSEVKNILFKFIKENKKLVIETIINHNLDLLSKCFEDILNFNLDELNRMSNMNLKDLFSYINFDKDKSLCMKDIGLNPFDDYTYDKFDLFYRKYMKINISIEFLLNIYLKSIELKIDEVFIILSRHSYLISYHMEALNCAREHQNNFVIAFLETYYNGNDFNYYYKMYESYSRDSSPCFRILKNVLKSLQKDYRKSILKVNDNSINTTKSRIIKHIEIIMSLS